ncbi:MAG: ATPase, T2SS/T4P/T4SS family [Planctomycetota bacterium]|nr:ATPase, T2SS/T4P/T4SS family [Planctomycetota bacterium]
MTTKNRLNAEMTMFWRRFARLLAGSVPLLEALQALRKESADKRMATAIERISQAVKDGGEISGAMTEFPQLFPPSITALVSSGEQAGELDKAAAAVADSFERGAVQLGRVAGLKKGAMARAQDPAGDETAKFNLLVRRAVAARASDIVLETRWESKEKAPRHSVRMRIDGALKDVEGMPEARFRRLLSRIKLMADLDVAEKRLPQNGRVLMRIGQKRLDLRVGTMPTVLGERLAVRILDAETVNIGLDRINLSEHNSATMQKWLGKSHGLIVVTGPTGSGKTTTLYSALTRLAAVPGYAVLSIESPVEFFLPGVTHIQVDEKLGLGFARLLQSALWQDPDVVSVGEIRDKETMKLLLETAHTGHIALTCLHARGAPEAVTLMAGLVSDEQTLTHLLGQTFIGVLAQLLARKLCPKCRERYTPPRPLLKALGLPASYKGRFYRAKGCGACDHGYRGRIALHEMLENSDRLRGHLAKSGGKEALRRLAVSGGMKTFLQDGIEKAAAGLTSIEEVLRVAR